MITERINIDVRPGGVPVVIHVTQYEVGLRQFIFTPYTSNGTQTVVAGSATLEGTKPDGYAFQQACEMVDGVITYTLQEQLCAVEGRVWSRLVIRDTDGGMIGYTAIVWVVGRAGVADDAVMSDSDISALRQFLDEFGTIDAYRGALNGALAAVGGPLVAATASAMTDTTKVYVYTGSESGYTEGHWYYWNGSAWTDGGVYQSTGINTDKTLTFEDMAADAKATGDAVAELKNDLVPFPAGANSKYGTSGQLLRTLGNGETEWVDVGLPTDEQTAQAVSDWLDSHPEATTTVQDGSLTEAKFSDSLKLKTIKDYVNPEMFGAKGDGVTDDTAPIQTALNSGKLVYIPAGTYLISGVTIPNKCKVFGDGRNTILQGDGTNHVIIIPSSSSYCELTSLTVYGTEGNTSYNAIEIANKNSEDAGVVYDAMHVLDDIKIMYGNYGLRIGSSVRGCKVTNIIISHATNDGLHIDGTDNSVINGSAYLCGRHGLYITQNNRIASLKPFANNGYGIYISGFFNNLNRIDIQQTTGSGIYIEHSNNYIQFVSDGVGYRNSDYEADISLIVFGAAARFNMILGTIRNGTISGMMNHIVSVEENGHPFGNIIDVTYAENWNRFPLKDVCAVNGMLDPSNTYKVNGRRIYSDFDLNIPSQANLIYYNINGNLINTTPIDFDTFETIMSISDFTFDSIQVGYGLNIRFYLKNAITAQYVYFRAYIASNVDISQKIGYVIRTYDSSETFVMPNYSNSKPSDGYIEGYYVFNDPTQISGVRLGLIKVSDETITTPATVELTVKEVEIWTK